MSVLTPKGRVCFPQVFEAVSYNGGKPKFSFVLLIDPAKLDKDGKAKMAAMVKAANDAAMEKFGVTLDDEDGYKGKPLTSPFKSTGKQGTDHYPADHIYIKLSSMSRPGVVGPDPSEGQLDETTFYPGCICHATYDAYAYDNSGNRGVSFGLNNIQKVGDGKRLGAAKANPEDEFEVVDAADVPF
jgi:hypothetical protein